MLLSKKKRQEYLKYLGYYKGKIDGKEGPQTKQAYRDLQNDHFFNKKDKDGIYGKNTDILLRNAYLVKKYTNNFDLKKELSCGCEGRYCTGYPVVYDQYALEYLQDIRDEYGPVTVTSPARCKKYNNSLPGSSKTSKHMKGKAFDITNTKISKSLSSRKKFINEYILLPKASYAYCNGYGRTKTKTTHPNSPNMGSAVHFGVK